MNLLQNSSLSNLWTFNGVMTGEKAKKAIVERLLHFRVVKPRTLEGEKWDEMLVRSLVKKLAKNGDIGQLEAVLQTRDANSPCVTIAQPRDGRLQISARKCHPCVSYCKLWRFPNIECQQQLRCLDSCQFSFALKLDFVCINPYHFVEVLPVPPPATTQAIAINDSRSHSNTVAQTLIADDDQMLLAPEMNDVSLLDEIGLADLQLSWPPSPETFSPLQSAISAPFHDHHHNDQFATTAGGDNFAFFQSDDVMQDIPTVAELDQILRTATTLPHIIASRSEAEPPFWAHVFYYEFTQRVGEVFKASGEQMLIDGYTATSEAGRFCLGALANVNRNPACLSVRKQIGRGCRVVRRNRDYFLECLNEGPVFVQSPICSKIRGEEATTVYRLPFKSHSPHVPGNIIEIFNFGEFDRLLHNNVDDGFSAVYNLQRMCHIRVSFTKGWGSKYRRQSVTATPCWVEILLPVPMQKLDRVLAVMGGPTEVAHSYT